MEGLRVGYADGARVEKIVQVLMLDTGQDEKLLSQTLTRGGRERLGVGELAGGRQR